MPKLKTCITCGKRNFSQLSKFCIGCRLENKRIHNLKSSRKHAFRYTLKYKYRLTEAEYTTMLQKQNNLCAICGNKMKVPHVDHNHETKKIRELLCVKCNLGLGLFNDDILSLNRALNYLKKHNPLFAQA